MLKNKYFHDHRLEIGPKVEVNPSVQMIFNWKSEGTSAKGAETLSVPGRKWEQLFEGRLDGYVKFLVTAGGKI